MTSIAANIPSAEPRAARLLHGFIRRHGFVIPSFVVAMAVCFWFVTWGDGRLFEAERFTSFYDAQARALLHGRFDVPPDAIGFEAFVRAGKSYGYFGIGPALIRLPLVILFPGMDGRWSRSLMLLACGINLVCVYRLCRVAGIASAASSDARRRDAGDTSEICPTSRHKFFVSLFVLCAGIGSSNVFILSRSYTYHEAILWGGTFALLFADRLLSYLESPRLFSLGAAGLFAFLSFHSRPTVGAGALLAMCVLAAFLLFRGRRGSMIGLTPIARPLPHVLLVILAIVITVGVYFGVNYGRFRTFDGVPVRYYSLYLKDPQRMQVTGGRQFHLENLPTGVASYLGIGGFRFGSEFPWIYMAQAPAIIGSPAIDVVEPYSSIPVSMPALFFLALAGLLPMLTGRSELLRRFRLLGITLLLGGSMVLLTVGITERYLHDFFAILIVAGAVGVGRLSANIGRRRIKKPRFVCNSFSGLACEAFSCCIKVRPSTCLASEAAKQLCDRVTVSSCEIVVGGPVLEVRTSRDASAKADPTGRISSTSRPSPLTPDYGKEGPRVAPRHGMILGVVIVLSLISIYINCAFALEFQREIVWGVPKAKQQELVHARQTLNHLLHRTPKVAAGE